MNGSDSTGTAVEDEPVQWEGIHHDAILRAGRYEIRERIGEGAMGVVHVAYDPQLHRKLAVKFVAPRRDAPRAHKRLIREAQAMAMVNHPNVVRIYDTGDANGQVFIAMDYVDGVTLTRWLEQAPRTWREVVRVFVQAGRGLAAAHAVGLVHRDFKPENVLVDARGVAHVLDFGLVRPVDESTNGDELDTTPATRTEFAAAKNGTERGTLTDDSLTKTGAILGTPAYMAPEQGQGRPADPRSDQFAFCVALFEGLYGHRPYEGGSAADVLADGMGELVPARRPDVPARIHAAIERGLRRDPGDRWPSMEALLEELERTRFNVSRSTLLSVGVAVAAGVAVVVSYDAIRAWWTPVVLSIPVEQAQVRAPMSLHSSAGGDPYVASAVANKGRLEVDVELPVGGRYYLHGLAWEPVLGGDHGDADSFFVYVDGGDEKLWHIGCQNELMPEHVLVDNWSWQPVLHLVNADSDCEIEPDSWWDLDAGPHRIVFRNREDAPNLDLAARLARVVLTNQRDWGP